MNKLTTTLVFLKNSIWQKEKKINLYFLPFYEFVIPNILGLNFG
jgi:hypothetical protein